MQENTHENDQEEPKLRGLLAVLSALEAEKKEVEEELKRISKDINHLRRNTIPMAMAEEGMQDATIDGCKVSVKTTTTCSILKESLYLAADWLRENGHGGIVKSNILLPDNEYVMDDLRAAGLADVAIEQVKIHPQTLKAWANEMVSKGEEIPTELFNVDSYDWTTTKPSKQ